MDVDAKLAGIYSIPLPCLRRRDLSASLSTVYARNFVSLNSTVGWLGITASPFCGVVELLHQHVAPSAAKSAFLSQAANLKTIQALGSTLTFPRL